MKDEEIIDMFEEGNPEMFNYKSVVLLLMRQARQEERNRIANELEKIGGSGQSTMEQIEDMKKELRKKVD